MQQISAESLTVQVVPAQRPARLEAACGGSRRGCRRTQLAALTPAG
ncbi:MAG: hypothetical protein OXG81_13325 [Acidobacteria bacterium]|nr:hypothetical protein [Acidobacteriota bacterium]